MNEEQKKQSELRFDLVSKDWVVIATGRFKRPGDFAKRKCETPKVDPANCVFCHLETQESIISKFEDENHEWQVAVIPNKYPAFFNGAELNKRFVGPYEVMDAIGHHEVIITRDHEKSMAQMSKEQIKKVIDIYQARYLALKDEPNIDYISIFHNHGFEAGASISHPHSQLIAMPLIDPDLRRSIEGSKRYFEEHGKCAHCTMMDWDRKDGERIIYENDDFIILCPFAPRASLEVRIYPKVHGAYFEKISEQEKINLADAVQEALNRMFVVLDNPSYNFFIHTAPCDNINHDHYHWHLEILPKTSTWAGFELGTGIEISTLKPEIAAKFLREKTK